MKRFADKFNAMKKIIFSNTIKRLEWQNSVLAKKDPASTVLELKKEKGKNISAGSITIAQQLLKEDLLDEFWILIHPIIANKGPRLFDEIDKVNKLQLLDLKKFNSGTVVLHYIKPEGENDK
jgi:dihydrofolate reductase